MYITTQISRYQKATKVCIDIHSTTDDGVQYTRDKNDELRVCKIGELVLDIPNPDNIPRNERKIDIIYGFQWYRDTSKSSIMCHRRRS